MGEAFVKTAMKQSFFDKGYTISAKGNGTFRLRKQVKSDNKGRGGIDFDVEVTDENGNSDEILVEAKNWGDYPVTKDMYNLEIKKRFDDLDPSKNKKRVLAIPKHQINKQVMKVECPKDNINVIPIKQKIDNVTIRKGDLNSTFEDFKEGFDKYIDNFVPDISIKRKESIEEDLKQGKEIKVVANKWDKSEGYIRNVASKLNISDRRKMPWKTISYVTYKPV